MKRQLWRFLSHRGVKTPHIQHLCRINGTQILDVHQAFGSKMETFGGLIACTIVCKGAKGAWCSAFSPNPWSTRHG